MIAAVTSLPESVRGVVAGAALFVLACNGESPAFPVYSPADGNPSLLTTEDIAVYEAVVSSYAQVGQVLMLRPAPGPPPGAPARQFELPPDAAEPLVRVLPYTSTDRDVAPQSDRWHTLDGKTLSRVTIPTSTVSDFQIRNSRKASLRGFRPRHLRVEWSEKMETLSCLYALSLPGYSRSKDEAIVEISCRTWALAGGGELLYLRRERGTWRVVAKQQTWIS